jgi:Rrf2 family iron-sulfur cluster assembly transcriptional regulator
MKIPTKGRYAVAAMMDLALNEAEGPLTIADIAEKQNISLSYLEQLFADLRKNGLVKGTRGPGGGYRLAKPAEYVSIAQIILAVDEKAVQTSRENEEYMPYIFWANLSQRMYSFLNNVTLAECIENPAAADVYKGGTSEQQPSQDDSGKAAA